MNGGTESGGPLAHRTTRGTRGAVRNVQVATQRLHSQCALQTATATPHQLQLLVVPCCGSWLLAPAAARLGPFSSGTRSGPQRRKYNKTNNNQFRYTQGLFVAGKYRGKSKNQMDSVIWLRVFGE